MIRQGINNNQNNLSLNLAIVGGGRTCKSFLELLNDEPFSYLNINLVGVCDLNPKAEGLQLAKEMGIFLTNDFMDLFKIKELDVIIELTISKNKVGLYPSDHPVIKQSLDRVYELDREREREAPEPSLEREIEPEAGFGLDLEI